MPQKNPVPPVLAKETFSLSENDDAVKDLQASETFKAKASKDNALTPDGHQLGFAKYQFDKAKMKTLAPRANTDLEFKRLANGAAGLAKEIEALQKQVAGFPPEGQRTPEQQEKVSEWQDKQVQLQAKLVQAAEQMRKSAKWLQLPEFDPSGDPAEKLKELQKIVADAEAKVEAVKAEYGALKKLHDSADPLWGAAEGPGALERPADFALQSRQVASYEVDQALGIGVIAPEVFGVDEDGKVVGISVQADGASVACVLQGKESYIDADLSDPAIQRGFSDLEVMDYITGQIDRHAGNIFVDPSTGKVTGIDNDLAFPEISRKELMGKGGQFIEKMVEGKPSVIHAETAKKILAMKPDDLRQALKNMKVPDGATPLSDRAIEGAVERLKELQADLKSPFGEIKVVQKFDQKTYDKAIQKANVSCGSNDIRKEKGVKAAQSKTSYLAAAEMGRRMAKEIEGVKPISATSMARRNEEGLKDLKKQTEAKIEELKTTEERRERHLAQVQQKGPMSVVARVRYGSSSSLQAKIQDTQDQMRAAKARLKGVETDLAKLQSEKLQQPKLEQGGKVLSVKQSMEMGSKVANGPLLKANDKSVGSQLKTHERTDLSSPKQNHPVAKKPAQTLP